MDPMRALTGPYWRKIFKSFLFWRVKGSAPVVSWNSVKSAWIT